MVSETTDYRMVDVFVSNGNFRFTNSLSGQVVVPTWRSPQRLFNRCLATVCFMLRLMDLCSEFYLDGLQSWVRCGIKFSSWIICLMKVGELCREVSDVFFWLSHCK